MQDQPSALNGARVPRVFVHGHYQCQSCRSKRIDIGRGFAAVINYPEPGPTVFRMARAECSAFHLAVLRRRVMFRQTGRWGNLQPFFFDRYRAAL